MRSVFALFVLLCTPLAPAQNVTENADVPSTVAATANAAANPQATPADDTSSAQTRAREIAELRAQLTLLSARLDALEGKGTTAAAQPAASGSNPATAAAVAAAPAGSSPAPPEASSSANPLQPTPPATNNSSSAANSASAAPPAAGQTPAAESSFLSALPAVLPGGATLNYTFDGYYEYNFNQPTGRVNQLRAYDVLSNTFSINQATVIFELAPDLEKKRRYGIRVDLQFGQATDTLQGNPANEPRPSIYQNIFQAYGTYIVPVGKGLNVDFGKWASSLGVEGNYTKDQINYTRSFYFYFLPFYHQGARVSYRFNDKFAVNYWLVNGTNQSEPTNGYRDELFGFVANPTKTITWTSNYYLGQEHPDSVPATNCTGPVQPGLCLAPIIPAPNGKLHIFDNYVTWQVKPKLTLTGEGDYEIERLWAHAAPGESSAPSHVSGGALYADYQATPRTGLAARAEYLSDRGGLFSGTTQALKEITGSYKYNLGEGFDVFLGFRRDWSNALYFNTHNLTSPANHQSTATLGLVWYYGGKQGNW